MSFFENTRKPVGLGGKIMVAMMNLGTVLWHGGDFTFWSLLWTPRCWTAAAAEGEHQETSEKMPGGYCQGH